MLPVFIVQKGPCSRQRWKNSAAFFCGQKFTGDEGVVKTILRHPPTKLPWSQSTDELLLLFRGREGLKSLCLFADALFQLSAGAR